MGLQLATNTIIWSECLRCKNTAPWRKMKWSEIDSVTNWGIRRPKLGWSKRWACGRVSASGRECKQSCNRTHKRTYSHIFIICTHPFLIDRDPNVLQPTNWVWLGKSKKASITYDLKVNLLKRDFSWLSTMPKHYSLIQSTQEKHISSAEYRNIQHIHRFSEAIAWQASSNHPLCSFMWPQWKRVKSNKWKCRGSVCTDTESNAYPFTRSACGFYSFIRSLLLG